jgi:hypothetical protein
MQSLRPPSLTCSFTRSPGFMYSQQLEKEAWHPVCVNCAPLSPDSCLEVLTPRTRKGDVICSRMDPYSRMTGVLIKNKSDSDTDTHMEGAMS